jgi:putative ABC transport system substrate-binding protein
MVGNLPAYTHAARDPGRFFRLPGEWATSCLQYPISAILLRTATRKIFGIGIKLREIFIFQKIYPDSQGIAMSLRHRQLLAAAAAVLSLSASAAELKSVAITAIVDHPALDAARKGVTDELKAEGLGEDKVKVQYQSAQGNPATAGQIARKFVGDKPDVAVAIATPSAQALVAASKTLPIVFTAVTDPVAAKLVSNWKASGTNVTGVSDMLPLGPQVDLILKVKPGAKRIGMVFSPGEVNSTIVVKELKAELAKRGMSLVEAPAPRTVDVAPAAKSLIGKVDAIYTSTDNNVVSTYESLVAVANQAKLPLIASIPTR